MNIYTDLLSDRPLNGGCVCSSVSKETDENMHFGPSTTAPSPSLGTEKRIK